MSDDLLDRLTSDLRPARKSAVPQRLLLGGAAGAVLAAAVLIPWLGLRPDIAVAYLKPMFWTKFAYTLLFVVFGLWAAERLSRPGGSLGRPLLAIFGLVALTGLAGMAQLMMSGPGATRGLVMGSTALVCPFYILALATPVYALTVLIMRRFAPTNLTLAGFAAGLMSGALACWVYAFHCTESGMPFITIWYTTGIFASALIGAALGRFVLRW